MKTDRLTQTKKNTALSKVIKKVKLHRIYHEDNKCHVIMSTIKIS